MSLVVDMFFLRNGTSTELAELVSYVPPEPAGRLLPSGALIRAEGRRSQAAWVVGCVGCGATKRATTGDGRRTGPGFVLFGCKGLNMS